jgi:hypothetical protein
MTDVERSERFERRLATALERLADDAPSTVDAAAVARAIAVREGAPERATLRRWAPTVGTGSAPLARLVRIGVVAAALLALLAGLAILAQRMSPASVDGPFTGRLRCAETAWSDRPDAMTLDCTLDTNDRQTTGRVHGALAAVPGATEPRAWSGQARVETAEGTWTGVLLVRAGPNGVGSGDVELTRFADTTSRIDLHLITADGMRWGVLGTRTTSR